MRRNRRVLGRTVLALALVACVEGPTAPGRFGELRIRAAFDAGDDPDALGVNPDSAVVRVTRSGAATPLVDATVAYSSDTTILGWVLDLESDEESLHVTVTIRGGATRLYEGESAALVQDESLAQPVVKSIAVDYVGPQIIAQVSVTPGSATLAALGATTSLAAEARDRHGDIVTGAAFVWSSANAGVATVDPTTGVVTAVANGTTTVKAITGAFSDSATVVVAQRITSVTVAPPAITFNALGATQTLVAHAADANGYEVATATFAWSSDAPAIASVDATGRVTAQSGGAATITAASDGASATAQVTVSPTADLASIVVTPPIDTLHAIGATTQYDAEARDAQGNLLAGITFTWSSDAADVASMNATGLATAVGHGATVIRASAAGVTGTATLMVDLTATIASVVVSPANVTLGSVGATQQFTAVARDAEGAVVPGVSFDWTSSVASVATVDQSGLATAVGDGHSDVTASVAGVSGTARLFVDLSGTVASVVVTPASVTLTSVGATQQFHAEAHDAAGAIVPGIAFTWSSSSSDVATVDGAGLAAATGHGATVIRATAAGVSGSATLSIDLEATVATVVVAPDSATITPLHGTQAFSATAYDANGDAVPGVQFEWTSSYSNVATVDSLGVATGLEFGHTTIRATVGGVSGEAALLVDLKAAIVSIEIVPDTATLAVGDTLQYRAIARDRNGNELPGVLFAWFSSDEAVATIHIVSGVATAIGTGRTVITATVRTFAATAVLNVGQTAGAEVRSFSRPDAKTPRGRW